MQSLCQQLILKHAAVYKVGRFKIKAARNISQTLRLLQIPPFLLIRRLNETDFTLVQTTVPMVLCAGLLESGIGL